MGTVIRAILVRSMLASMPVLAILIAAPAGAASSFPCRFTGERPEFPSIPIWAYSGAYQDSSLLRPRRCIGSFTGPLADSILPVGRTITVRFKRDRFAEARKDFGGYRIYRVFNSPDTTVMVLIRRFSRQDGDERTWNFSIVDTGDVTRPFVCGGQVVHDSIVTFVDPDSSGRYDKVCKYRIPENDLLGACDLRCCGRPCGPGERCSRGDSIMVLLKPPGPHHGFRTWYAITYEKKNTGADATYEDMFVPDTTGYIGPCRDPDDPTTCPNLNNKCFNMIEFPVEATPGPTANLERVGVVPNPYRAREAWDQPGASELHFTNLPEKVTIKIYTIAGDLVAQIEHDHETQDFERWDLKNQNGREVASGIYMYRIESKTSSFTFQDRFIVIR
jgi:hypothetical protein